MIQHLSIPIVQIGSSRGIRIPKKILDTLGFTNSVVAIVSDNAITLKAKKKPRDGWEADYKRCHELKEDELLIPHELDIDLWKELDK